MTVFFEQDKNLQNVETKCYVASPMYNLHTVKVAKTAGRLRWPAAKMADFSNHQIFSSLSILN